MKLSKSSMKRQMGRKALRPDYDSLAEVIDETFPPEIKIKFIQSLLRVDSPEEGVQKMLGAGSPKEVIQKLLGADSPKEVVQKVLGVDSIEEAILKLQE